MECTVCYRATLCVSAVFAVARCPSGLDWPLCHCVVAQAFDEHRRPLAPSKFFDVCVTEKNSINAVGPLPTPLIVMITKLSLIGIPSKNSISL